MKPILRHLWAPILLGAIAVTLAIPTITLAQDSGRLDRAGIERLKKSTVFIRLEGGDEAQTGSGFLLRKEGEVGFVVTNSHVVTLDGGKPGKTIVVFNSGQPEEFEVVGEVVTSEPLRDLAIVKVESDALPETIPSMNETDLYETLPVYIAGFPFGEALSAGARGPAITVSRGTVSSIRRDDARRVAAIQIDGSINPGNSGGPIVGADGKLIGIAVAKVSGTQIGMAIPVDQLNALLKGQAGPMLLVRGRNASNKMQLEVRTMLHDPMSLVKNIDLHIASAPTLPPTPNDQGQWEQVKAPNAMSTDLRIDGNARIATVLWRRKHGAKVILQHRLTMLDGSERWSIPTSIDLPEIGQALVIYRGKATKAVVKRPAEQDPHIASGRVPGTQPPSTDPHPSRPNPLPSMPKRGPGVSSGGVLNAGAENVGGLKSFNESPEDLVSSFCWSSDGAAAYTLSKSGSLKKYSVESRELIAETKLEGACGQLTRSQVGLVAVMTSVQRAVVIDEQTLEIKRSIQVAGLTSIACSAQTSVAYVATGVRQLLIHQIDLARGKSIATIEPDAGNLRVQMFKPETLVASPDGKYLFIEGGIEALIRLRVDQDRIVVEESTPRIRSGRRSPIVVSSNSRLVAAPSGGGNSQAGTLPRLRYGTYIFKTNDFSIPAISIESGAYPAAIAVDVRARLIYANSHELPLIVFNAGGSRVQAFNVTAGRAPEVKQILPHPKGFRAGVLTEHHLYWADVTDLKK